MQDLATQTPSNLTAYGIKFQKLSDNQNFSFFDQTDAHLTQVGFQYSKKLPQFYLTFKHFAQPDQFEKWSRFSQKSFGFPHSKYGSVQALINKKQIELEINSWITPQTWLGNLQVYAKCKLNRLDGKMQNAKVGIRKIWYNHLVNLSFGKKALLTEKYASLRYNYAHSYQYERRYGIYESLLTKVGVKGFYNLRSNQLFWNFNLGVEPIKNFWAGLKIENKVGQQSNNFQTFSLFSLYKITNYCTGGLKVAYSRSGSHELTGALDLNDYLDYLRKIQLRCSQIGRNLQLSLAGEAAFGSNFSLSAGLAWGNATRTLFPQNYSFALKIND